MPQRAASRPFLVAHLDHDLRLHPRRAAAGGDRERRRGPARRLQARAELGEVLAGEARAHGAGVGEIAGRIADGEVKVAEARARAGNGIEAHHREVGGPVDAHLEPVRRIAGAVGGVRPLADNSFEAHGGDGGIEILAALGDLVGEAKNPCLRICRLAKEPQQRPPRRERQLPQIETFAGQQIEDEVGGRRRHGRAVGVDRPGAQAAALEALEVRLAGGVEHHGLAVENQRAGRQAGDGAGDLRQDVGGVVAAAVEQPGLALAAAGEHAKAVVLELEDPAGAAERALPGLRLHDLQRCGVDRRPRRAQAFELREQLADEARSTGFFLSVGSQTKKALAKGEISSVARAGEKLVLYL